LRTVAGTVRDGIAGLRSLLVDIYPPSLHSSGLAVALRDLVRTAASGGIELVTEIDDEVADTLPPPVQEAAFRVAQEALRNVARHAGATRVIVRLVAADDEFALLEVEDDGRGFDPAAAAAHGHFGLTLRADAARGVGAGLSFDVPSTGGTLLGLVLVRR
jgi:signal transduction histidine kinase